MQKISDADVQSAGTENPFRLRAKLRDLGLSAARTAEAEEDDKV